MALPILDGNQSATTLSTILSGGQHITAHTVVSLGTQAITDITSAVSGTSVCVGSISIAGTPSVTGSVSVLNFPASQSVTFGATTGSVSVLNFPVSQAVTFSDASLTNTQLRASAVTVGGTVTIGNSVTISSLPAISGTVTIGSALPAGTNQIGVVTIGAGTVTIGAGTAQIGSVTASISGTVPISISSVTVGAIIGPSGGNCLKGISGSGDAVRSLLFVRDNTGSYGETSGSGIGVFDIPVYGSVTIGAGTAQIGSVTASLAISSTAITSGSFTSLTSATLVPGNTARKMATVYNLGAGQLFVNAGATATTLGGGFMVALSSGDFYECDYTTTTLSAIFATAGTASWVSH